jgi:hypothetical protein
VKSYVPGDVVIYEPFYTEPLFKYYLPSSIPSYPFPLWSNATDIRRDKLALDTDLDRVSGNAHNVWVIFGFENLGEVGADAANTKAWFREAGYKVVGHEQLNQVEYYRYAAPASRLKRAGVKR